MIVERGHSLIRSDAAVAAPSCSLFEVICKQVALPLELIFVRRLILLCVCFDLLSLSSLLLQNRFKSPPH
nr:hypothetical protein CFP56_75062 [Quercus suber]